MPQYARPRHRAVEPLLDALDPMFLGQARCYFGGGTRLVLALNEYRESADIDFICSDRDGYRELREAITNNSLGPILKKNLQLARDVMADQYGIRTVVDVAGERIKFEIVLEARIEVAGALERTIGVPCLDETSCFAEKFLANADRWHDQSALSRDIIDLAFMTQSWDESSSLEGHAAAVDAYGHAVDKSVKGAVQKLAENKSYLDRCAKSLAITDMKTLKAGLAALSAGKGWRTAPRRRAS